jgi:hypothetical protein
MIEIEGKEIEKGHNRLNRHNKEFSHVKHVLSMFLNFSLSTQFGSSLRLAPTLVVPVKKFTNIYVLTSVTEKRNACRIYIAPFVVAY